MGNISLLEISESCLRPVTGTVEQPWPKREMIRKNDIFRILKPIESKTFTNQIDNCVIGNLKHKKMCK